MTKNSSVDNEERFLWIEIKRASVNSKTLISLSVPVIKERGIVLNAPGVTIISFNTAENSQIFKKVTASGVPRVNNGDS